MSIYTIMAFNAATDKIKQNIADSQAIDYKRIQIDTAKEELDLNKKLNVSKLKQARNQGLIDDFVGNSLEKRLNEQYKNQSDELDAMTGLQDITKFKLNSQTKQVEQVAETLLKQDPNVQSYVANSLAAIQQSQYPKDVNPMTGGESQQAQMSIPPAHIPSLPGMSQIESPMQSPNYQNIKSYGNNRNEFGVLDAVQTDIKSSLGDSYWFNPETNKVEVDPNRLTRKEARLSGQQETSNTFKLRKEFIDREEVKDYMTVNTAVRSMDSLLKKGKDQKTNLAIDQGLITLFNKMTDPASVVRESEYARTPQNLSLANRFSGALDKLEKGGAGLTEEDRQALVWGAKVIADERGRTYNETLDAYRGIAIEEGLDESRVLRQMKPHTPFVNEGGIESGDGFQEGGIYEDAQGNKAKYENGQWIEVQ